MSWCDRFVYDVLGRYGYGPRSEIRPGIVAALDRVAHNLAYWVLIWPRRRLPAHVRRVLRY